MRSKKILIIEDHPDCRDLLKIVLSRSGYLVFQAGTGLEALERASATSPDVIVMDFGLPDVTGDKLILSLKADPLTKRIPVIVTTGYMSTEVSKRAILAGAATVLLKPYDVDELISAMEQCFSSESDREALLSEATIVRNQLNPE
jgi:CheY-like chemotaxis protein